MSDHEHEAGHGPIQPEMHFSADDLTQFDADDVTAGRAICKMLSLFFVYTVAAMSIAGAWTYYTLN